MASTRMASLATVLAVLGTSASAWAEAKARLVYSRDRAARDCPDEAALHDAVRARLGYEPFAADAIAAVTFAVRSEGKASHRPSPTARGAATSRTIRSRQAPMLSC